MPHAALFVVQASVSLMVPSAMPSVSMPHAALFVVQADPYIVFVDYSGVSMPHAALFVVQACYILLYHQASHCFNAARGFVCGARRERRSFQRQEIAFQCRTRLCLWCKLVARSPCISCVQRLFWKVSGFLKRLSERMQSTRSNTTSLSGAIPCAISPCHAHGRNGKS